MADMSEAGALTGIARLAAGAPRTLERGDAEYFRLPVRSVLNRVSSRRVGFEWSINPYRGCTFGCRYCYARYTHEFMELAPEAFERQIYVKADAGRVLWRDLLRHQVAGSHIAIGAATDPYQPAEKQFGVTRTILETLLRYSRLLPGGGGLSLSITTKSNLVLQDLALLRALASRNDLHVNVSITTLHRRLARALEPRAPRPDLRLETVRRLAGAGIDVNVFVAPVLPGITDGPRDLEALVAAAARAGAQGLMAHAVFLKPSAQRVFFPFLAQRFPHLLRRYRRWYGRGAYAPEDYRRALSATMGRLRARYGIKAPPRDGAAGQPDHGALAEQMELVFNTEE
ncbi:MAG: radical SAM protein [Candidatus Marinimicrobia bacterium]|nr:radical SAM protein [Candidatus Neomarinimicrobiota bacterium]